MKLKSIGLYIFMLIILFAVIHLAYYYPRLPERMASHFDISGNVDGWLNKETFLVIYVVILLVLTGMTAGTIFLFSKLPTNAINIPHRNYWLSPERREKTQKFIVEYTLWFNNATLAFFVAITHLTFRVNLGEVLRLENHLFWLVFIIYILFTIIWTIHLFIYFKKPPTKSEITGDH